MNKELILVMNEKLPINIKEEINDNLRLQILEETKKAMWSMVEYKELQMMYSCALKAIQTKFEILNTEFKIKHKRNPISNITTRLKRNESVIKKLIKYNKPISIESIENNLHDFAGIRIVCTYIDDIYMLADALIKQDDVILIEAKDYIKNPKPNGYRSLHLIVEVPIFLSDKKKNVKVEVQIRTIAMDFWASLEHQMKYKKDIKENTKIVDQLKQCATVINQTDEKMLALRKSIDEAEDIEDEFEVLKEKLRRIDEPLL